jgi:hypothetical protein
MTMFPRGTIPYGLRMRLRILVPIASLGLVVLTTSTPAGADVAVQRAATAVVVGSTASSPIACGDNTIVMSSTAPGGPTYVSPVDGVITSWTHGAGPATGSLRLLVTGPSTVTPGAYTIFAKGAMQAITASTFNTFPARLPIAAGQQLGLDVGPVGLVYCGSLGQPGDVAIYVDSFDTTNATEFTPDTPGPGARLNVSAVVEPDADHDGFGDVSQDFCPQSATTQVACPAPDTTVTKKPKKSSSKRKATIKFAASISGSTFTCAVDGKAAQACTSPFTKKYKFGKHTVVITAMNQFGVPDPTPVTVKFKVKRP